MILSVFWMRFYHERKERALLLRGKREELVAAAGTAFAVGAFKLPVEDSTLISAVKRLKSGLHQLETDPTGVALLRAEDLRLVLDLFQEET